MCKTYIDNASIKLFSYIEILFQVRIFPQFAVYNYSSLYGHSLSLSLSLFFSHILTLVVPRSPGKIGPGTKNALIQVFVSLKMPRAGVLHHKASSNRLSLKMPRVGVLHHKASSNRLSQNASCWCVTSQSE